jgi:hypothetical protein
MWYHNNWFPSFWYFSNPLIPCHLLKTKYKLGRSLMIVDNLIYTAGIVLGVHITIHQWGHSTKNPMHVLIQCTCCHFPGLTFSNVQPTEPRSIDDHKKMFDGMSSAHHTPQLLCNWTMYIDTLLLQNFMAEASPQGPPAHAPPAQPVDTGYSSYPPYGGASYGSPPGSAAPGPHNGGSYGAAPYPPSYGY